MPSSLHPHKIEDAPTAVIDSMLGEGEHGLTRPATCMAEDARSPRLDGYVTTAFAAQMAQVYHNPETIDTRLEKPPDAFLLTARSAVPVADAVRGYYAELGLQAPYIGYIRANRLLAAVHGGRPGPSTCSYDDAKKVFNDEALRLRPKLAGMSHVCVIDQYVASGGTLQYAGEILEAADIANVTAIRGLWYAQAYDKGDELDFKRPTSRHARLMHTVGVMSCQRSQKTLTAV